MDFLFHKALCNLPSELWPKNRYTQALFREVQKNNRGYQTDKNLDVDIFNDANKLVIEEDVTFFDENKYSALVGDHRLYYVALKEFRGIRDNRSSLNPFLSSLSSSQSDKEQPYFGISFSKDGCPISTVVLGQNGSRKTSFYSAIELLTTGSMTIATKRGYVGGENLYRFIRNVFAKNDPKVAIGVGEHDYNIELSGKQLNHAKIALKDLECNPFFCSESDINIFEVSGQTIENYIEDLVGLNEVNCALRLIESSSNKLRIRLNKWIEESRTLSPLSENYANIFEDYKKSKERLDQEKEYINNISEQLTQFKSRTKQEIFEKIRPFVETIMEQHYSLQKQMVEIAPQNRLIDGYLYKKDSSDKIDPRHYFNNFRFKIYIISYRVAIALFLMKTYNIRFPLVFDDVFESSDFINRTGIDKFIKAILQSYIEIVGDDHMLQIIFFTQDEVLATGVFRGLNDNGHSVSLVNLFSIEEADNNDYQSLQDIKPKTEPSTRIDGFINLCDTIKSIKY